MDAESESVWGLTDHTGVAGVIIVAAVAICCGGGEGEAEAGGETDDCRCCRPDQMDHRDGCECCGCGTGAAGAGTGAGAAAMDGCAGGSESGERGGDVICEKGEVVGVGGGGGGDVGCS